MKKEMLLRIGILCFLGVTLFLSFNLHRKSGYFTYHGEIWSDKAAYFVYLPAAINYNFKADQFPDSIEFKTGNGFVLNRENGKITTKCTYVVALLQLPFYSMANLLAEPLNYDANGFSPIYHWSINVSAVFYLVLGLLFLKKFLTVRFGSLSSVLALLSVFLATNLFYYSLDETGMSHVYTFFLFCLFLYFIQKTHYLEKSSPWKKFIFGLLVGLIVLIRPSNILFLSVFFFLDITGLPDILTRIKRLVNWKSLVPIFLAISIIVLPQLLYWKYLSGSFIYDSYPNEGFNWLKPKIILAWFSPNNGLFLYTPFYLFILALIIRKLKRNQTNAYYFLFLFLCISYVFSSWWSWNFGCAFGARSYVEYLAIFSIPLASFFNEIKGASQLKIFAFAFLILALTAFNLKLIYSYDGCYYGQGNWDWNWYVDLVLSPTK